MRLGGPEALAFAAVVMGSAALIGVFFCMRRKGPREGWAPIYVAAAVAVAAFALVLADDAGIAELGLPKHPGTSPAGRGL